MNQVLTERITTLVEKAGRPGVLGAPGMKAERALRTDLKSYFAEIVLPIERLHLEDKHFGVSVNTEMARHVVTSALHPILTRHRSSLETILYVGYQHAWMTQAKLDHFAEADGPEDFGGMPDTFSDIDFLGETAKKAATWAETEAAKLVVGLDDSTVDRIAGIIEQGIEQQLGSAATGRLIRQELADMSVYRAAMIAATETARAMSAAMLDKLGAVGVEYKQWIPSADACEICLANVDQGAIPVDDEFDSGDDAPPAHPNCRCAVAGARPPEEEA